MSLADALKEFSKVQDRYSEFGAHDTEPRGVLADLIEQVHLGVDPDVPDTAAGWQLFSDMAGCGAAATAMATAGRAVVEEWLQTETRVRWVTPHAGLTCCLRLPDLMQDGPFVGHLREKYDTQVVPGTFFEAPGFVRLGYGIDPDDLREALANFSAALDDLI